MSRDSKRARRVVIDGLGFSEGPRWHEGRLYFSDMGAAEVVAVDLDGNRETVAVVPTRPSGLGWLPDGRMLIVSMEDRKLLRKEDGKLVEHADLSRLVSMDLNDMVVDGRGNAYVGNPGFDLRERPLNPRNAELVLVTPAGESKVVDNRVIFPNGSAVTPDGQTLIVAETFGNRLTAFDIEEDGSLANRRTWAELPNRGPDGICLDAEGAVWVADATGQMCVRIREGGGVLEEIVTDRGCYACALGGPARTTLLLCIADGYRGATIRSRTGAIEAVEVDVPGAGWP